METKNQIENPDEEDMQNYRFIGIDPLHEVVEIFEIVAGCEEDAFDLVNEESPSNFESSFLLSDKMVKQLHEELKKVKDVK